MDRLLRAVINSWNGLGFALRSEAAFRQELAVFLLAVPLAFLITEDGWKRLALIGVLMLLFVVELLNTAIEKLSASRCSLPGRSGSWRWPSASAGSDCGSAPRRATPRP
jgi:diacylglycerol kinase